jgi:hypothetical protein
LGLLFLIDYPDDNKLKNKKALIIIFIRALFAISVDPPGFEPGLFRTKI